VHVFTAISDILDTIGAFLSGVWDFLIGIWDLFVNVWNVPSVIWDHLCIFWANVVVFWDQIQWDQIGCVCKYILIGACSGSVGLPIILAIFLVLAGFGDGIRAGSIASNMMARHHGYTPVGGIVANMQSAGTRGGLAFFQQPIIILGCILGALLGGYRGLFNEGFCGAPLG
jgi:hypothetical protein